MDEVIHTVNSEQLLLGLDWGREPWRGLRPRCLTKGYLRDVDNFRTIAKPARADDFSEFCPDPAQWTLFLQGKS